MKTCSKCGKEFKPHEVKESDLCPGCYVKELDKFYDNAHNPGSGECFYHEGLECISSGSEDECYDCWNFPAGEIRD